MIKSKILTSNNSRILIHNNATKSFELAIQKGTFNAFKGMTSYCPLSNKEPANLPDFKIIFKGAAVNVLCIGDQYTTGKFFLDQKKMVPTSNYVAYYFTNSFDLYLIPTQSLKDWYQIHKKYLEPKNPDGHVVSIGKLLKAISGIEFVAVH